MNNEPVAWMDYLEHSDVYDLNVSGRGIPLYTHPHPDNLGLAESIIAQQQAEIERLSNDNYKFIKAMANKDSHIESLKQLLNDSALRKASEK